MPQWDQKRCVSISHFSIHDYPAFQQWTNNTNLFEMICIAKRPFRHVDLFSLEWLRKQNSVKDNFQRKKSRMYVMRVMRPEAGCSKPG